MLVLSESLTLFKLTSTTNILVCPNHSAKIQGGGGHRYGNGILSFQKKNKNYVDKKNANYLTRNLIRLEFVKKKRF